VVLVMVLLLVVLRVVLEVQRRAMVTRCRDRSVPGGIDHRGY